MTELLDILANPAFWIATLRVATPLILGTLGVLLCERAGVLNLGIEGIMVAGAFTGWLTVYAGHGLWTGVLVAALTGAVFGLLHAWLTVGLALSQHVSGLGITLLATALSYYGYRVSFPKVNTPPTIEPFAAMDWLGIPILSAQTPLTLLALLPISDQTPVLAAVLAWRGIYFALPASVAAVALLRGPRADQRCLSDRHRRAAASSVEALQGLPAGRLSAGRPRQRRPGRHAKWPGWQCRAVPAQPVQGGLPTGCGTRPPHCVAGKKTPEKWGATQSEAWCRHCAWRHRPSNQITSRR